MKKFFLVFIAFFIFFGGSPELRAANDFWEGVGSMAEEIWGEVTGSGVPDGKFELPAPEEFNEIGQNTSAREFILNILNFLLSFLGIVAVAMIIYAGFLYVSAAGDDGQSEKAKNIIMYAVIGIFVILVSYALVNTIIRQAGKGGDDRGECGNSIVEIGEDCDDGNTENGDGCSEYCLIEPEENPGDGGGDGLGDGDPGNGGLLPPNTIVLGGGLNEIITLTQGFWVSLAGAQEGVTFSLGGLNPTEVIWNFGDNTSATWQEGDPILTHRYGTEKSYQISFVAQTAEGDIFSASKQLVVGGLRAQFNVNPAQVVVGTASTLDGSLSRSAIGSIIKYTWTCEGTGCFPEGTGIQFPAIFTEPGDYQVTLEIENNIGAKVSVTQGIQVYGNQPLVGQGTSCESTGNPSNPAEYRCDATGSTNISGGSTGLTYQWDFDGDQKTSTSPVTTYTFDSPGTKNVQLIVTQNYKGETLESEPFDIALSDVKTLGVDFISPSYPLYVGQEFTFRAQSDQAETYLWTFPAQAAIPANDPMLHFDTVTTYFNAAGGPYTISLTVTKGSEQNTITKQLYVREEGEFMAIPEITVGGTVYTDPSEVTTDRKKTISFASKSIDEFGQWSPTQNMNETWSLDGATIADPSQIPSLLTEIKTYIVALKVSRPGNPSVGDTAYVNVVVQNILPTVERIFEDHGDLSNAMVGVEGIDRDGTIEQYTFQLMENGQIKESQILNDSTAYFNLNSQSVGQHWFQYKIIVQDNNGGTAFDTSERFSVTIEPNNTAPQVLETIQASPSLTPLEGTEVFLSVKVQDTDGDALNYTWDFGDGSTATGQLGPSSQQQTVSASHIYNAVGSYNVILTINDTIADPVSSAPATVQVQPAP